MTARTPTIFIASLAIALTGCKKHIDPNQPVAEVPDPTTRTEVDSALIQPYVKALDNFRRVRFGFDSAALDDEAMSRLDRAARILKEHRGVRVSLVGHADPRGAGEYNMKLAWERARAVRSYLLEQGVAEEQVTAFAVGEQLPLVEDDTQRAYSLNRRVEFVVTWDPYNQVDGSLDNDLREAKVETDPIF